MGALKGTDESLGHRRHERQRYYQKAKYLGDLEAAMRIVEACTDDSAAVDRLIDAVYPSVEAGIPLRCAIPHPPFDDQDSDGADLPFRPLKNALPVAFQAWLAETIGAARDTCILQCARVGRTKLPKFPRFLWQPAFEGDVDPNAAYILADDVFTVGGTLAALRSHIVRNGGKIVGLITLAHGTGRSQPLAISGQTCDELNSLFGANFGTFWQQEIGHDSGCLTEAEGRFLVQWALAEAGGRTGQPLLQHLRARLSAAAATGE
ncbi:MAG: hypothetical protein J0H67_20365 [Rhodospirillales bacterium]|nr:hypothetical protein [Rhodospirillales bacterium]